MAQYIFHELTLVVESHPPEVEAEVAPLLQDLSFVRRPVWKQCPVLSLTLRLHPQALPVPQAARAVFQTAGLCGFATGHDFYLTEGSSLLHLQGRQGVAQLAPDFFHQPPRLRQQFWAFGVLKLLRSLGFYGLHAAGLVADTGRGILLVGSSGCGKSTLTIGLVRQGWGYLSDDAVLLRRCPEGIAAAAFRKPFAIEAQCAAAYADLPLGRDCLQPSGKRKRRVDVASAYPAQAVPCCFPRTVLFPRLVSHPRSAVRPLERPCALRHLLTQSSPPLFDRGTMAQHLDVLKHLLQQATPYELLAGQDLYHHPGQLLHLLAAADGGESWCAS
jgi:hypothetical protein